MNKGELIKAVAGHTGLSQGDAGKAVDAVVATIGGALKAGDSIAIAGFGTFTAKKREAREGRNPLTGKTIQIAAKTSAAFKPAAALKDL
jgi:DNA-binding protein HU-beta